MSATRTDSSIVQSITQQKLYDGIKQGFSNAGYSIPHDELTENSSDKSVIYKVILDASKTYGSFFLKVRVTSSLGIGHQILSGWNLSTHTGVNGSSESSYSTFSNSSPITVVSLNGGNEFKLVLLGSSTNFVPLGYISPITKPNWWDMSIYPYGFIASDDTFTVLRSCSLNPYSNNLHDIALSGSKRLNSANPQSNRRDVVQGLMILTQANTGVSGKTSDDIVVCSAYGTSRFDLLQVTGSTDQYLILIANTGGLGIKVN